MSLSLCAIWPCHWQVTGMAVGWALCQALAKGLGLAPMVGPSVGALEGDGLSRACGDEFAVRPVGSCRLAIEM